MRKGAGGTGPASDPARLDIASLQKKLGAAQGKDYWRSLEELADTEAFRELLRTEFPGQLSEWEDPGGRRRFLKLMGASLALAGLSACTRQPDESIAPYIRQPEELLPGRPLFFATSMTMSGVATGILAESHEGRPTKIEGNPEHPASLGATDGFAQASVLTLYDPDRSQTVTYLGEIRPYLGFLAALRAAVSAQKPIGGAGLRILTETVGSPTLAGQIRRILEEFPSARWHQFEPAHRDGAHGGSLMAFGERVDCRYRLETAAVILALDSDFLCSGPACLRHAREFALRRRLLDGRKEMNRLYTVESTVTNTGAVADHRLAVRPGEVETLARALARELGIPEARGPEVQDPEQSRWIRALASDLQRNRGTGLVIAGDPQPPTVHALAHAINQRLGNAGRTVVYTDPIEASPVQQLQSIRGLAADMDAGKIDLLLILGGNPVYNAPADLRFGERLQKVALRVHLSLYADETSELCQWHVPEAHFLESWSDGRAFDGTAGIVQPLIAPLYRGKSAHEVLAALSDRPERTSYEIVREYWQSRFQESAAGRGTGTAPGEPGDFDRFWRRALHDGFIGGTAFAERTVSLKPDWSERLGDGTEAVAGPDMDLVFRTDPAVHDGRFSNNGWLQELPKPLTRLTWDNAALISPATARRLGLSLEPGSRGGEHGEVFADVVDLRYRGRSLRAAAWIVPGHPEECVTIHMGYGRTRAGRVGTGAGFNAFALQTSEAPWSGTGLTIHRTGERFPLAQTQLHHNLEGRDLLRTGSLAAYLERPGLSPAHGHAPSHDLSLYPGFDYTGYAWGMAIDLHACIGCGACVVACQAENNIPIVGKQQVGAGREMHWIRVDRYYKGDPRSPETFFQPVPCMHCENAPCEVVCPVAATAHSAEGLNVMVYNRCVGTRYCSNNCPYKVRRFNFLLYADWDTPSLKLGRNPEVTVRSRGVMEKCTYCVQRISRARIEAEKEDRQVKDGEIVTACQGVCPTQAIIFGNVNDPSSRVARMKADPRNYGLLSELNTRPRTTYLGAVKNLNPDLER